MSPTQDQLTEIYVLRHATPAKSDVPNRSRPLSDLGQCQAMELATNLSDLGITAIYTSPFKRAVNTVMPFCKMANLTPVEREDLRESEQDEQLPEVRSRLMQALTSIAESNPTKNSLVCTHGGWFWAVISYFDKNFDYEDYE